ncbi:MAG: hypothetical protein JWM20_642 [Patescibacteria group bacterium]|nr:hypothetical protein [Patescibacteria group bacterium]
MDLKEYPSLDGDKKISSFGESLFEAMKAFTKKAAEENKNCLETLEEQRRAIQVRIANGQLLKSQRLFLESLENYYTGVINTFDVYQYDESEKENKNKDFDWELVYSVALASWGAINEEVSEIKF